METKKQSPLTHEELMFLKALYMSGDLEPKHKKISKSGYLYLVKDNASNLVKIGITTNHKERLRALNTMVPHGITTIDIFQSNRYEELEKEVHDWYKDKRRNGEWFDFNDADIKDCLEYLGGKMTYDDVRSSGG